MTDEGIANSLAANPQELYKMQSHIRQLTGKMTTGIVDLLLRKMKEVSKQEGELAKHQMDMNKLKAEKKKEERRV